MKVNISLEMELTPENLDKLKALIPGAEVSAPAAFDSPSEEKVEQKKAKAAKTPEPEAAPSPNSESAEKVTKTDIRAVALKLSKAGKQKELAAAFAKFGCKKLSDFDARPEEYPALMKELVSIDG